MARLIGAAPDEVALTENATVAWQMGFYALAAGFRSGDRILTARAEYAANYVAFLQVAHRTGAVIEVVPDDATGALDPDALSAMIDDRVRLIAITWVPTNGGLVNPAAEVGRIARAHGIPYLLDACQAVGQMPVDVAALGCDLLAATGRKFLRAPRGTGFLYARRALLRRLEPPMIDHFAAPWVAPDAYRLRDDARRFESWENNYAARLGLGVAVDYALALGLEAIQARCRGSGGCLARRTAPRPGRDAARPRTRARRHRQLLGGRRGSGSGEGALCRGRHQPQHLAAVEHSARRHRARTCPRSSAPRRTTITAKPRSSGRWRSSHPAGVPRDGGDSVASAWIDAALHRPRHREGEVGACPPRAGYPAAAAPREATAGSGKEQSMTYVDGFVVAVPKAKVAEYTEFSRRAGEVWKEHGALQYVECVADDVPYGELTSFPRAVQATEDETVVFAWITYNSREHRDTVNAKVMADPRLKEMGMSAAPFDGKRMIYGGFTTLLEM